MGLDKEHYGTKDWNPFAGIIKAGNAVVIKPNFVIHHNGVQALVDYYQQKGANVKLYDFRKNWYPHGFKTGTRVELSGDPNGYRLINLRERSFL